jgi:sporulation protein YlmC with PRC-barrel domain
MSNSELQKLSDTGLILADPAEYIRGRTVIDRHAAEIGHVSDLFINADKRKIRMLEIRAGGFLGLGDRHFLLPVQAIVSVTKDAVRVNQTREHILNSPAYDPDLIKAESLHAFFEPFYGYYGLPPYRETGYQNPSVPLLHEQQPVVSRHQHPLFTAVAQACPSWP